jgi:phage shock protein PspC (stress-responsive transcriptional regulator)
MSIDDPPTTSLRLSRVRRGRWLGGVCAGVAPVRSLGAGWLRLAFVLGALLGGLGVITYLACWLIIPAESEGSQTDAPSGLVALVQAGAAAAALGILALLGTVLTVFGFGWVVFGLAAVVLAGVLSWRRLGPGWALLPIAALTLPAVAVATSQLRLAPSTHAAVYAPATPQQIRAADYRSGFGTLLIDLRHTSFPAGGTIPLRINAGVRRTIVALPTDQCVHVVVHYNVNPLLVRLASLLNGHSAPLFSDAVIFGRLWDTATDATASSQGPGVGPRLDIDFSSQGGSLYVRDYPGTIDPDGQPDWPGYPVTLEPRPDTRGTPKKAAAGLVRHWRERIRSELTSQRTIDALMPGPCG